MYKIRRNVFETNSSSSHVLTVTKLESKKIKKIILGDVVKDGTFVTIKDKTKLIYYALCAFVMDYQYVKLRMSYITETNFAFKCLKEMLEDIFKDSGISLIFKDTNYMGTDELKWLEPYEELFGEFGIENFKDDKKVCEYINSIKDRVKEYIFGDYIFEYRE